jgi:nucleotide-binding universal stress UspA family protein
LTAEGHVLRVVGDHADSGRRIARFAAGRGARGVVIGSAREPGASRLMHADLTDQVVRDAECRVLVVPLDTQQPVTSGQQT